MSSLPESKLAREAELSYALICTSTDYDAWREGEEAVTVEEVRTCSRRRPPFTPHIEFCFFFFLFFFFLFFFCHLSVKQVIKTLHTNAHLSKTVAQSILASVHEAVASGKVLTQAKGCSASLPLSLSCSSPFMKTLTLARAHVFQ